jgi:hypothetical protein
LLEFTNDLLLSSANVLEDPGGARAEDAKRRFQSSALTFGSKYASLGPDR